MAETQDRENTVGVEHQGGIEHAPGATPTVPQRPRLGDARDSWVTVLKDMLREAPRTGLIVFSTLAIAVINAIAYVVVAFVDCSAPPPAVTVILLFKAAFDGILSG